jgi:hypothetical protein
MKAYLEQFDPRRPPVVAAPLLALIVELYRKGLPFPTRQEAAELVGGTKNGIDSALSTAMSRGLISCQLRQAPGHVARRESVIHHRYYIPNADLLAVVPSKPISHTARSR